MYKVKPLGNFGEGYLTYQSGKIREVALAYASEFPQIRGPGVDPKFSGSSEKDAQKGAPNLWKQPYSFRSLLCAGTDSLNHTAPVLPPAIPPTPKQGPSKAELKVIWKVHTEVVGTCCGPRRLRDVEVSEEIVGPQALG